MITYSEAKTLMASARSSVYSYRPRRKLANNTYLYEVDGLDRGTSDFPDQPIYGVRLHNTFIVLIRPDGLFELNTGGWDTVTTKERINSFSPAHVHSGYKRGDSSWVVSTRNDPTTPPKLQKCRTCKHRGYITRGSYFDRWGYIPKTYFRYTANYAFRNENYRYSWQSVEAQEKKFWTLGEFQVHRAGSYGYLEKPVWKLDIPSTCWACHGAGMRDYGSKPNPVKFIDGMRVDSYGVPQDAEHLDRLYETPEAKERREAREAKHRREAERARKRQVKTYRAEYRKSRRSGYLIAYKAVDNDLRSAHTDPRTGRKFLYPIGTTVTAPDWNRDGACGRGLHFSPSPTQAAGYRPYGDNGEVRFLAVEVKAKEAEFIDWDKLKVPTARVLCEVNGEGTRINSATRRTMSPEGTDDKWSVRA